MPNKMTLSLQTISSNMGFDKLEWFDAQPDDVQEKMLAG